MRTLGVNLSGRWTHIGTFINNVLLYLFVFNADVSFSFGVVLNPVHVEFG